MRVLSSSVPVLCSQRAALLPFLSHMLWFLRHSAGAFYPSIPRVGQTFQTLS